MKPADDVINMTEANDEDDDVRFKSDTEALLHVISRVRKAYVTPPDGLCTNYEASCLMRRFTWHGDNQSANGSRPNKEPRLPNLSKPGNGDTATEQKNTGSISNIQTDAHTSHCDFTVPSKDHTNHCDVTVPRKDRHSLGCGGADADKLVPQLQTMKSIPSFDVMSSKCAAAGSDVIRAQDLSRKNIIGHTRRSPGFQFRDRSVSLPPFLRPIEEEMFSSTGMEITWNEDGANNEREEKDGINAFNKVDRTARWSDSFLLLSSEKTFKSCVHFEKDPPSESEGLWNTEVILSSNNWLPCDVTLKPALHDPPAITSSSHHVVSSIKPQVTTSDCSVLRATSSSDSKSVELRNYLEAFDINDKDFDIQRECTSNGTAPPDTLMNNKSLLSFDSICDNLSNTKFRSNVGLPREFKNEDKLLPDTEVNGGDSDYISETAKLYEDTMMLAQTRDQRRTSCEWKAVADDVCSAGPKIKSKQGGANAYVHSCTEMSLDTQRMFYVCLASCFTLIACLTDSSCVVAVVAIVAMISFGFLC